MLAAGKSVQSPVVNAWANYAQGEYDTLAGQIDGFMQFSENPAQTIGNSVNYFLSDPLKNNPVYGAGKWCSEFKSAVASNEWNTASYKLGVGVVNTAEVAGSIAIGGKIGGKIPTGKVSVPKVNALSKIGNAIDNFGAPQLVGANGIVISGAVPAEVSVSSSVSAGALGVRAGAVAGGTMAAGEVVYASKNSGQSSGESRSQFNYDDKISNARDLPGVAVGGEKLSNPIRSMRGTNGNIGLIPQEVADKLRGREFSNFDDFRSAFWKEYSNSSYASEFSKNNITRMSKGLAPIAPVSQHYKSFSSYILHHKNPIHNGGSVYDLDTEFRFSRYTQPII